MRTVIIVMSCLLATAAFGQVDSPHSIQDAISQDIKELKKYNPNCDNIFVVTKLDDQISLPEKVFRIENGLNAKFLKKKDKNFLVEVRVASQSSSLKIDLINYSIVKLSNKGVKLINLNNGMTYVIGK